VARCPEIERYFAGPRRLSLEEFLEHL
jgi:hypothetical protein